MRCGAAPLISSWGGRSPRRGSRGASTSACSRQCETGVRGLVDGAAGRCGCPRGAGERGGGGGGARGGPGGARGRGGGRTRGRAGGEAQRGAPGARDRPPA